LDLTPITIEIGPQRTPYLLHRRLLIRHSKYFKAALEGSFNEVTTNEVNIGDDISDDVFRAFVPWIYKGEVVNEALRR